MRFQVTYVYITLFEPLEAWENSEFDEKPPLRNERHLTDVVQCMDKTGPGTFSVLEKQFRTKGVVPDECCNGVGDGGGENEGCVGVHAIMEKRVPSYVRRRCLGHLPWRVADAGLRAMTDIESALKDINNYLRDGITWSSRIIFSLIIH